MDKLIPITINENDEQIVSGRALHKFLGVATEYKDWIKRRIEYGFTDGIDFCSILSESTGGRPSVDHALKIDMAKELCMLEKNEKGKQARRYFIQVEKDWNNPDKIMARALKIAERKLNNLTSENKLLLTQNDKLQQQLDGSKNWFTIKRVAAINNINWRDLSWRDLKHQSIVMGKQIQKIFDANFGEVNLYHVDVWKAVYPTLVY